MRIPTVRGLIDRRVLANFRVDPDVLSRVCPPPFRPQLVDGFGVAGICLIRLRNIRPKFLPAWVGISSENAAHRIAVEWDADATTRSGVFIPRRDTSSMLNAFAGGRIFPGVHHRARFDVRETERDYYIAMESTDGSAKVVVDGRTTNQLHEGSIFPSVEECSQFFAAGSLGTPRPTRRRTSTAWNCGRIAGRFSRLPFATFSLPSLTIGRPSPKVRWRSTMRC